MKATEKCLRRHDDAAVVVMIKFGLESGDAAITVERHA